MKRWTFFFCTRKRGSAQSRCLHSHVKMSSTRHPSQTQVDTAHCGGAESRFCRTSVWCWIMWQEIKYHLKVTRKLKIYISFFFCFYPFGNVNPLNRSKEVSVEFRWSDWVHSGDTTWNETQSQRKKEKKTDITLNCETKEIWKCIAQLALAALLLLLHCTHSSPNKSGHSL